MEALIYYANVSKKVVSNSLCQLLYQQYLNKSPACNTSRALNLKEIPAFNDNI